MKVVRTILLGLLFIAGVFLASANVQPVELVLLPNLPIDGWPAKHSVAVPLFVLVLGALVVGVLVGGLGALLQHVKLRTGLRRARKENRRQGEELAGVREKLALVEAELEQARRECAQLESHLERSDPLPGASAPQTGAVAADAPAGTVAERPYHADHEDLPDAER